MSSPFLKCVLGDVELTNMQLKPEALNALKLPVKVKAGFLGSVKLKVCGHNSPFHPFLCPYFPSFGWDFQFSTLLMLIFTIEIWFFLLWYEEFLGVRLCHLSWVFLHCMFLTVYTLQVPWSRLGQDPVLVQLDHIFLLAEPATHVEGSSEDAVQEVRKNRIRVRHHVLVFWV